MLLDVLYDLAANGEFVSAFAAEKVGGKENRVSIFDCRNTHPDLSMEGIPILPSISLFFRPNYFNTIIFSEKICPLWLPEIIKTPPVFLN